MIEFILKFFVFLLPIISNLLALNNIIKNKLTFMDNIKIVVISMSMSILFVLDTNYKTIVFVAVFIIPTVILAIRTKKIFLALGVQILLFVIQAILDCFLYSIIYVFFDNTYSIHSVLYWIVCVILMSLTFVVTKFIGDLSDKHKDMLLEIYKSKYLLMVYTMVFIAAAMFYFLVNWRDYVSFETAEKVQSVIGFVYGTISMGVCICLLHMGKKEEKYKHEQIELKNLREYTENLEKLYTDMRRFRHDYINIISSISAFIEEEDYEGLEEYFNENIQAVNKTMNRNNYKLGLLKNINLQEVKGLISAKVLRAQELGIDVIIDITEVVDNVDMDKIDLVRCLGILLDNAIEASMESDSKKMNVALIKKDRSVIIVISNTYGENMLPIGKMFKEGISTKGDNRGLGLSNLKRILDNYENISLDTYIEDEQFVQEICIYTR